MNEWWKWSFQTSNARPTLISIHQWVWHYSERICDYKNVKKISNGYLHRQESFKWINAKCPISGFMLSFQISSISVSFSCWPQKLALQQGSFSPHNWFNGRDTSIIWSRIDWISNPSISGCIWMRSWTSINLSETLSLNNPHSPILFWHSNVTAWLGQHWSQQIREMTALTPPFIWSHLSNFKPNKHNEDDPNAYKFVPEVTDFVPRVKQSNKVKVK